MQVRLRSSDVWSPGGNQELNVYYPNNVPRNRSDSNTRCEPVMWMCCYVRISSTRPAQSRPEKTKSLLVRSAGTCSKQMFAPSPECVCVLLHPVFPYVLVIHAECMFVCVCVLRPPPPIHSDPLCDFCHFKHPSPSTLCDRTPAVQRSFNERSTWERRRRGSGRRRRRISWVFIYLSFPPSLHRCHLCRVKRCKAPSPCGSPTFGFD